MKEIKVTVVAVTTDDGGDCDESCPSFEFTDHGPHWCRYWDDHLLYGRLPQCKAAEANHDLLRGQRARMATAMETVIRDLPPGMAGAAETLEDALPKENNDVSK